MHIELTEQQRRLAQEGQPIDVVDPQTNDAYVLIAKLRFEQVRSLLTPEAPVPEVPEGIRLSKEALRRDLPGLLANKRLFRQWVAYHRNERIGIARDGRALREE